jgi:hypothetical protein
MSSKARKDWKANDRLIQALAPTMAPKSGFKEMGEGLGQAVVSLLVLPALRNDAGLLELTQAPNEDES